MFKYIATAIVFIDAEFLHIVVFSWTIVKPFYTNLFTFVSSTLLYSN